MEAGEEDGGACARRLVPDGAAYTGLPAAHHAVGVRTERAVHRAERYGEGHSAEAIRSKACSGAP